MATRSTPQKMPADKPAARESLTKGDSVPKKAASTGPAGSTGARTVKGVRKRLPAATTRALKELEAGKLNRYADADELFQKMDIKLGQED